MANETTIQVTDAQDTHLKSKLGSLIITFSRSSKNGVFCLSSYCDDNYEFLCDRFVEMMKRCDSNFKKQLNFNERDTLTANNLSEKWAGSIVCEASWMKSSNFFNAIKVVALQVVFVELRPSYVEVKIEDKTLRASVVALCQDLGIPCSSSNNDCRISSKTYLLHFVRGILELVKTLILFTFACLVGRGQRPNRFDKEVLFVSYNEIDNETNWSQESRYFSSLGSEICGVQGFDRILKHVTGTPFTPSPSELISTNRVLRHMRIEDRPTPIWSFVNLEMIVESSRRYFFGILSRKNLTSMLDATFSGCRPIRFLMTHDFVESFIGAQALRYTQFMSLHSKVAIVAKNMSVLLFPFEGQDWERSLVDCFSRPSDSSLKGIIAFPHTVLKAWDLRGVRFFSKSDSRLHIAVQSFAEESFYTKCGVSRSKMLRVEPLRYIKLLGRASPERSNYVLYVASIDWKLSRKLWRRISKEVRKNHCHVNLRIKMHPSRSNKRIWISRNFPSIELNKIGDNHLLPAVAICSPGTSVTDFLIQGATTIALLDEKMLDMTPMDFRSCVSRMCISDCNSTDLLLSEPLKEHKFLTPFFSHDPKLSAWRDAFDRVEGQAYGL